MIVPARQLNDIFQALRADKHSSEDKAVLVFAANGDVDSLCSTQQLEVRGLAVEPGLPERTSPSA